MGTGALKKSIFWQLIQQDNFEEGSHWTRKSYSDNDVIFSEGEYTEKVFFILSGTARIMGDIQLENNHRIRPGIRDLKKGEVFGELSMVDECPHSASVVAVSECQVAIIDCQALRIYLKENLELGICFYQELGTILARRLRKSNEQVLSILTWGLKVRDFEKYLK